MGVLNPVDATVGRQLLLDDYLLSTNGARRVWLRPRPSARNPILRPITPSDLNSGLCPVAAPFDDGIIHDPDSGEWMLWYMSGWFDATALRRSPDGLEWSRPAVKLKSLARSRDGRVLQRDGVAVCLDYSNPAGRRFVLYRYVRERLDGFCAGELATRHTPVHAEMGELYESTDGEEWFPLGTSGYGGDNTTFFFDPFRSRWVFSIRTRHTLGGRTRGLHVGRAFEDAGRWEEADVIPWVGSANLGDGSVVGDITSPEIYKISCMPYESAMLGIFAVYRGPSNAYAETITQRPKVIDLYLGISRDGYHYTVAKDPILVSSQVEGSWNYGYLHMVNGGLLPVGDETRIYYSAFSGESPALGHHMYAGGAMGFASFRRDGFCALTPTENGPALVVTRPLRVRGTHLFLNLRAPLGKCVIAVTNLETGAEERHAITERDGTHISLRLSTLTPGKTNVISIAFVLSGECELYSFWVSGETGESHGYSASGRI